MPDTRAPRYLKIRYARGASVLMTIMGAVLLVCAALSLLMPFIPVLVPIGVTGLALLGGGLGSFFRHRYRYDPATGGLTVFMAFGPGSRGLGGPKGEHLYFDGRHIIRVLPDGGRHRVSTVGANRQDIARLVAALPTEPGPAITDR